MPIGTCGLGTCHDGARDVVVMQDVEEVCWCSLLSDLVALEVLLARQNGYVVPKLQFEVVQNGNLSLNVQGVMWSIVMRDNSIHPVSQSLSSVVHEVMQLVSVVKAVPPG